MYEPPHNANLRRYNNSGKCYYVATYRQFRSLTLGLKLTSSVSFPQMQVVEIFDFTYSRIVNFSIFYVQ